MHAKGMFVVQRLSRPVIASHRLRRVEMIEMILWNYTKEGREARLREEVRVLVREIVNFM